MSSTVQPTTTSSSPTTSTSSPVASLPSEPSTKVVGATDGTHNITPQQFQTLLQQFTVLQEELKQCQHVNQCQAEQLKQWEQSHTKSTAPTTTTVTSAEPVHSVQPAVSKTPKGILPSHASSSLSSVTNLDKPVLSHSSSHSSSHGSKSLLRMDVSESCPWLTTQNDSFLKGVGWPTLHERLATRQMQVLLSAMHKEARSALDQGDVPPHRIQRYFSKKHEHRHVTLHMLNTSTKGELLMKVRFHGTTGAGTLYPVAGKGKPFQILIHELRFLAGASLPVHFTGMTKPMASIIKWPENTSELPSLLASSTSSTSSAFRGIVFTWNERVVQESKRCFTEWVGSNGANDGADGANDGDTENGEKGTKVTYVLDDTSHCVYAILPGGDRMLANVGTWKDDEDSPKAIKAETGSPSTTSPSTVSSTVSVRWHLQPSAPPTRVTPQPYTPLPSLPQPTSPTTSHTSWSPSSGSPNGPVEGAPNLADEVDLFTNATPTLPAALMSAALPKHTSSHKSSTKKRGRRKQGPTKAHKKSRNHSSHTSSPTSSHHNSNSFQLSTSPLMFDQMIQQMMPQPVSPSVPQMPTVPCGNTLPEVSSMHFPAASVSSSATNSSSATSGLSAPRTINAIPMPASLSPLSTSMTSAPSPASLPAAFTATPPSLERKNSFDVFLGSF